MLWSGLWIHNFLSYQICGYYFLSLIRFVMKLLPMVSTVSFCHYKVQFKRNMSMKQNIPIATRSERMYHDVAESWCNLLCLILYSFWIILIWLCLNISIYIIEGKALSWPEGAMREKLYL
jgi:hypothetical protein